jgi:Fur family ferric uptake transcriptional regulator
MAPHFTSYEECLLYCRQQGMRLSQQRLLILRLLWNTDEHLSARAIYDRLRQQGEEIGHTSVYQNLDALAQARIVERVERADGCLYSHQTGPHSHVHCLEDDRLIDVMVTLPQELIMEVEQRVELKVTGYQIEFFACHCP